MTVHEQIHAYPGARTQRTKHTRSSHLRGDDSSRLTRRQQQHNDAARALGGRDMGGESTYSQSAVADAARTSAVLVSPFEVAILLVRRA